MSYIIYHLSHVTYHMIDILQLGWLPRKSRQAQALEEDALGPHNEIDDASRRRGAPGERLSHGVMEGIVVNSG